MKRKKSPRTQKNLEPLGDVLQSLLQNSKTPLSDNFLRWKLWNSWPSVVGDQVAKSTTPVHYINRCLYVWVDHPARMQELTFCVRDIIRKVNSYAGKTWIRQIRFTLDRKSVPGLEESEQVVKDFLSTDP